MNLVLGYYWCEWYGTSGEQASFKIDVPLEL